MGDLLLAAQSLDRALLVRAAVTTELCEEARLRHVASPTATAALGRALTGAVLLGSLLKGAQSILLQWRGDGPLGPVVAEARADLGARAYVARPQADLPPREGKIDVGGGVGRRGRLVVVKDLGLREPYRSEVPLQTGEMGEDLAHYLLASEQIPSAVGLGVYVSPDYAVEAAGGVLVQALPGASEDDLERVIGNLAELAAVTPVLRAGEGAPGLLSRVLQVVGYESHEIGVPRFSCRCGPERLDAALGSLEPGAARELLATEGEVRVRCAFCATDWRKLSLDAPWERLRSS